VVEEYLRVARLESTEGESVPPPLREWTAYV
jgi:hypothetical protein